MATSDNCPCEKMGNCLKETAVGVKDEDIWGIIYDIWQTNRTKGFAENLQKYLTKKGYATSIQNTLNKELHEGEKCPIIAICLLHSRIEADVNYTLADLNSEMHKRIILVMLHYRNDDTRTRLYDEQLKRTYPEISVHNCFLQKENENIKKVNKNIKKDLEEREIKEKNKNKKEFTSVRL